MRFPVDRQRCSEGAFDSGDAHGRLARHVAPRGLRGARCVVGCVAARPRAAGGAGSLAFASVALVDSDSAPSDPLLGSTQKKEGSVMSAAAASPFDELGPAMPSIKLPEAGNPM